MSVTSRCLRCLVPTPQGDGGYSAKVTQQGQPVAGFEPKSLFGSRGRTCGWVVWFLGRYTVTRGDTKLQGPSELINRRIAQGMEVFNFFCQD